MRIAALFVIIPMVALAQWDASMPPTNYQSGRNLIMLSNLVDALNERIYASWDGFTDEPRCYSTNGAFKRARVTSKELPDPGNPAQLKTYEYYYCDDVNYPVFEYYVSDWDSDKFEWVETYTRFDYNNPIETNGLTLPAETSVTVTNSFGSIPSRDLIIALYGRVRSVCEKYLDLTPFDDTNNAFASVFEEYEAWFAVTNDGAPTAGGYYEKYDRDRLPSQEWEEEFAKHDLVSSIEYSFLNQTGNFFTSHSSPAFTSRVLLVDAPVITVPRAYEVTRYSDQSTNVFTDGGLSGTYEYDGIDSWIRSGGGGYISPDRILKEYIISNDADDFFFLLFYARLGGWEQPVPQCPVTVSDFIGGTHHICVSVKTNEGAVSALSPFYTSRDAYANLEVSMKSLETYPVINVFRIDTNLPYDDLSLQLSGEAITHNGSQGVIKAPTTAVYSVSSSNLQTSTRWSYITNIGITATGTNTERIVVQYENITQKASEPGLLDWQWGQELIAALYDVINGMQYVEFLFNDAPTMRRFYEKYEDITVSDDFEATAYRRLGNLPLSFERWFYGLDRSVRWTSFSSIYNITYFPGFPDDFRGGRETFGGFLYAALEESEPMIGRVLPIELEPMIQGIDTLAGAQKKISVSSTRSVYPYENDTLDYGVSNVYEVPLVWKSNSGLKRHYTNQTFEVYSSAQEPAFYTDLTRHRVVRPVVFSHVTMPMFDYREIFNYPTTFGFYSYNSLDGPPTRMPDPYSIDSGYFWNYGSGIGERGAINERPLYGVVSFNFEFTAP